MSSNDDQLSDHDASGHLISPFYGYLPTRSVCYIFLILFGVSTFIHFVQAVKYRAWWMLPTAVLAGIGETAGWSGRLWSSFVPLKQTPFVIQIVCTIVAPTPLVGAMFIAIGRMIAQTGPKYSRLSPRLYSRIFLTCDIIGFFTQSAGGSLASNDDEPQLGKLGADIMLGGIIFQLVILTVFAILSAEYFWRYQNDRPWKSSTLLRNTSRGTVASDPGWIRQPLSEQAKRLVLGVSLETLFLYIRAIYRTIELADGFTGRIIRTQVYFNVLDGAMVVLAMYTMNILHPARLLRSIEAESIEDGSEAIPMTMK